MRSSLRDYRLILQDSDQQRFHHISNTSPIATLICEQQYSMNDINISRATVAKRFTCAGLFNLSLLCKFNANSASERISTILQYLHGEVTTKTYSGLHFYWPTLYSSDWTSRVDGRERPCDIRAITAEFCARCKFVMTSDGVQLDWAYS